MQTLKDKLKDAIKDLVIGICPGDFTDAIDNALEVAEQHFNTQPSLRWISVEERLPKEVGIQIVKTFNEKTKLTLNCSAILDATRHWYTASGYPVIAWLEEDAPAVSEQHYSTYPRFVKTVERNPTVRGNYYAYLPYGQKAEVCWDGNGFKDSESGRYYEVISWLDEGAVAPVEDKWIVGKLPPMIEGKDYSENVLAEVEGYTEIQVMSLCWCKGDDDSYGYVWGNSYGDIHGESDADDDYKVLRWMPIPKL